MALGRPAAAGSATAGAARACGPREQAYGLLCPYAAVTAAGIVVVEGTAAGFSEML